jgi:hypothetical protein
MVSEVLVKAKWLNAVRVNSDWTANQPAGHDWEWKKLISKVTILGKLSSLKWHRQNLCTIQLCLRVCLHLRFLASAKDHTRGYVLDRYGRCRTRVADERWRRWL